MDELPQGKSICELACSVDHQGHHLRPRRREVEVAAEEEVAAVVADRRQHLQSTAPSVSRTPSSLPSLQVELENRSWPELGQTDSQQQESPTRFEEEEQRQAASGGSALLVAVRSSIQVVGCANHSLQGLPDSASRDQSCAAEGVP